MMQNVTSKRNLAYLSAAVIGIFTIPSMSASAADYYNCAAPTGCQLIQSKKTRSNYDQTKYPIVLAHGFSGWNRLGGVLDYFHGVPQTLSKNGADVFATKTSSVNTTEVRGEQLLKQVNVITAITGKPKVNLIGHSYGGLDSRYVASVAPEKVASVTTVSTPASYGLKFADWIRNKVVEGSKKDGYAEGEFNPASQLTLKVFKFLGIALDLGSGIPLNKVQEQDGWATIESLSTEGITEFNAKHPAPFATSYCGKMPANNVMNNVAYYSFAGNKAFTNPFDASDYLLAITGTSYGDDPNDGLVPACSARLGYVISYKYRMNHLDTINQLFGITSWRETSPLSVYRTQVNRLKKQGY